MPRSPIAALLAFASTLALNGAAFAQERPLHLVIAPGKVGEVCLPLAADDTLAWRFKARPAADFNLHHHVGDQVSMPVQRKAATEDQGEYLIDRRNDWCLMWTEPPGQRVTVSGAWSVRKPGTR